MNKLPENLRNITDIEVLIDLYDQQDTSNKILLKLAYKKLIADSKIKFKNPTIKDDNDHFYTVYNVYENEDKHITAICYCKSYKLGCKVSYIYNTTKKSGTLNGQHDDSITHKHRNKLLIKARSSNIEIDGADAEFNGYVVAQQIVEDTDNVTVQMVEKELVKRNKGQFSQIPSSKQIQGYITAKKNKNTDLKKEELVIYQSYRFDNSEKMIKGISICEGRKSITFGMTFFIEQATDKHNPITQFYSDSSFRTPEQDQHQKKDRRLKLDGKWYQYDVLSGKCPKTSMIIPIFFALMGGKEEQDYLHQFRQYKRIAKDYTGRPLQLVNIKQDYELARKKAWETLVVNVEIDGNMVKAIPQTEACTLHFMINQKKKMHQCVKGAFKQENRKLTWKILFLVSCLQYINPEAIQNTFQQIKKYINQESDDYNEYFEYVFNVYVNINSQIYPFEFWNYYRQLKDPNFRRLVKFANIDIENFFLQMAKLMKFIKNPTPSFWCQTVKDICQIKLKHWMDYTTNPNQRKTVSTKYKGDKYLQANCPFTRKFINKMMKYKDSLFGEDQDDINIPEILDLLETFNDKVLDDINTLPYFDGDLSDEDIQQNEKDNKIEVEDEDQNEDELEIEDEIQVKKKNYNKLQNQNQMKKDGKNKDQNDQPDLLTRLNNRISNNNNNKQKIQEKKPKNKKIKKTLHAAEDKDLTSDFSSLDSSDKDQASEKEDIFKSKHKWIIVDKQGKQQEAYLTIRPGKCLCQDQEIIRKSYNFQNPYRCCQSKKCKHFKWIPNICNEQLKSQHEWLYKNDLAQVKKKRNLDQIKENDNDDDDDEDNIQSSSQEIEEERPQKKSFQTPYQQQKKKNALQKNKKQIIYQEKKEDYYH